MSNRVCVVAISALLGASAFATLTHKYLHGGGPVLLFLQAALLLSIAYAVSRMRGSFAPALVTLLTLGPGGLLTYSYWATHEPSTVLVIALVIAVYAVIALAALLLMARSREEG